MAAMQPKPAWKTYTMVTLAMLPTLIVWMFWLLLLVPKFRQGWEQGTAGSHVEYMHAPVFIMAYYSHKAFLYAPLVLACVILLLVTLELTLKKWWPRWRLRVLTALAVLFNALFIVTICFNMVLCLMLVQVSQKGIKSLEKTIKKID
jgi:hypothetical protein